MGRERDAHDAGLAGHRRVASRSSHVGLALTTLSHMTILLLTMVTGSYAINATWRPPANKTEWGQRTIYQVMTDRLDRGNGDTSRCTNFYRYCGGVYKGILKELPYIKEMGYDAIWWSPISEQTFGRSWQYPEGYHGYWPKNLWALNDNFGTAAELQEMIDALHAMGFWAMLDIVPNHSGFDYAENIAVFNDSSYYHTCDGCVAPSCGYSANNDQQVRQCRLSELPDLNQNIPYVANNLLSYHKEAYVQYQIDAYRVDAARHIEIQWLDDLRTNISIFSTGEFATDAPIIASRLAQGALDSSLNFPLFDGITDTFTNYAMNNLRSQILLILQYFGPNSTLPNVMPLLGNFVENHDNSRLLCVKDDIRMYENAYATQFFFPGMAITYYGAEFAMLGQRDPMWVIKERNPNYRDLEMYKVITTFIRVRKALALWTKGFTLLNITGPYADSVLAFARGDDVVVVLNALRHPPGPDIQLTISGLPATAVPNTQLTDVLFPSQGASSYLTILPGGTATFYLSADRWPQVFVRSSAVTGIDPFIPYQQATWSDAAQTALICFWTISFALAVLTSVVMRGFVWKLLFNTDFKKLFPATMDKLKQGLQTAGLGKVAEMMQRQASAESTPPAAPAAGAAAGTAAVAVAATSAAAGGTAGDSVAVTIAEETAVVVTEPEQGGSAVVTVGSTAQHSPTKLAGPAVVPAAAGAAGSSSSHQAPEVQLTVLPSLQHGDGTDDAMQSVVASGAGGAKDATTAGAPGQAPSTEAQETVELDRVQTNSSNADLPVKKGHKRVPSLFETAAAAALAEDIYNQGVSPFVAMPHAGSGSVPEPSPQEAGPNEAAGGALPAVNSEAPGPRPQLNEFTSAPPQMVIASRDPAMESPPASPGPRRFGGQDYPGSSTKRPLQPLLSMRQSLRQYPSERPPMRQLLASSTMLHSMRTVSVSGQAEEGQEERKSTGASTFHISGGVVSPVLQNKSLVMTASNNMWPPGNNRLNSAISFVAPSPGSLTAVHEHNSQAPPTRVDAVQLDEKLLLAETMLDDTAAVVQTLSIPDNMVLQVAMEYSIPHLAHLGFGDGGDFMFGGLGKVVDIFLRFWPGPVGLCCPLYQKAYNNHETDDVPKFLPPGTEPTLVFSVTVSMRPVNVEIFTLQDGNITYFFIQADTFRHRLKADIYAFHEESEMLRWISIMNQATAVVISTFNCRRVQFHDWHATLSLLYLPEEVRPEVLVVLHNAHYNGTFPVPNDRRRIYLYGILDLDRSVWPRYLEHKGNVDMLNSVCTWVRAHQNGKGCVAVSPRYAESILQKLDVMWQMRRYHPPGILNALPFMDCLASEIDKGTRTIESALAFKAESKDRFQAKFGLDRAPTVGPDPFSGPQLVVFLGRMTHQKGADTIAMAAEYFLDKCPQCQLVMVGPICDTTGVVAAELMKPVIEKYPGRVYAPPGAYFGGADKALLLAAADFCLVPSRFEPCGLVDIEFGWNGALMIGHNTGGLNKMPGIMYNVESNARAHLAAQLGQAVVRALALGRDKRRAMFEEAMARRFPTKDMMDRYEAEWEVIHQACIDSHNETKRLQQKEKQDDTQEFFSTLWKKHNKKDVQSTAIAKDYDRGKLLRFVRYMTGSSVGRHQITFFLLLLLQSYCIYPTAMVNGYVTFVYLGYTSIIGCERLWDKSFDYFPDTINSLAVRVLLSYGIYTISAPIWMWIAMSIRPKVYIFWTVYLVLASALVAHASMVWTAGILPAIIITSAIAPVGLPLISLNFLGQSLEVAEVGVNYMTITETTFSLYMTIAAILAAVSLNSLPFVVTFGFGVLVAFLLAGWFSSPHVLHPAYEHVRLVMKHQWGMILKIKTFWLTSIVMMCENVALILTAYQVLLVWDLRVLMVSVAANYGARMLSMLTAWMILRMRCSQLYIQRVILFLSSMPGFAVAKLLVAMYAPSYGGVILTFALVEYFFGCRSQMVGLLAFETLPSRELVAVWQLVTMIISTIVPAVVLAVGFTLQVGYGSTGYGILIAVVVCEGVRFVTMLLLWKVHPGENLATL